MPSKRIDRLSMVCGNDIKPGTFYNWVKRLRQKGCMDLPASTGHSYRVPENQEVVRVNFHDTDMLSYEQPLDTFPTSAERVYPKYFFLPDNLVKFCQDNEMKPVK